MGKVRKTTRRILVAAVGVALLVLVIALLIFQGDFPAAAATLTYNDAVNNPISRIISDLIHPGASLSSATAFTVTFAPDTSVEIAPGTDWQIDHFGERDGAVQVLITLRKGQISAHVGAQSSGRAYFRIQTVPGVLVNARQSDFIVVASGSNVLLGARHGSPAVTLNRETVSIPADSGLTVPVTISADTLPPKVQPWAMARLPAFAPDGSALSLPITLARVDGQTGSDPYPFYLKSGDTFLLPDGTYAPTIRTNLPTVYSLPTISIPVGTLSEWPITLSELQFGVVDTSSKPLTGVKLVDLDNTPVNSSANPLVLPDALLVPAVKPLSFMLARLDAPDQGQPTGALLPAPGQRMQVSLRNDYFGGGSLAVSMINSDGSKRPTGTVAVYIPGSEDNPGAVPVQRLRTDETPLFMAHGDYMALVSVPNSLTRRYPVTVNRGALTTLTVALGTLTVSFNDASGHPISAWLYVATDADLKRLGVTVDQARQTAYGYAFHTGQLLTLPAGDYTFRIDALHAPAAQTVTVTAGQNAAITVTALS